MKILVFYKYFATHFMEFSWFLRSFHYFIIQSFLSVLTSDVYAIGRNLFLISCEWFLVNAVQGISLYLHTLNFHQLLYVINTLYVMSYTQNHNPSFRGCWFQFITDCNYEREKSLLLSLYLSEWYRSTNGSAKRLFGQHKPFKQWNDASESKQ